MLGGSINPVNSAFIVGNNGNNVLNGTDSNNQLIGLGGNDRLRGMAGADMLSGGTGADTLEGGSGNASGTDNFADLNRFLRMNRKVDFQTANLLTEEALKSYNWAGLDDKEVVIKQIKAYQRMLRLTDDHKISLELLSRDIQSVVQIASIPRNQFMQDYLNVFGGDESLAKEVYDRALAVRSNVLLEYMNIVQNSQRHAKAVKAIT